MSLSTTTTTPTTLALLVDAPGSETERFWAATQYRQALVGLEAEAVKAKAVPPRYRALLPSLGRDMGVVSAQRTTALIAGGKVDVVRYGVGLPSMPWALAVSAKPTVPMAMPMAMPRTVKRTVKGRTQEKPAMKTQAVVEGVPRWDIFAKAVFVADGHAAGFPLTCPFDRLLFLVRTGMEDAEMELWARMMEMLGLLVERKVQKWKRTGDDGRIFYESRPIVRVKDKAGALAIVVTRSRIRVEWNPSKDLFGRNDKTAAVTEADIAAGLERIFGRYLAVPVRRAGGYGLRSVEVCRDFYAPIRWLRDVYAFARTPRCRRINQREPNYLCFGSKKGNHLVLYGKDLEMRYHYGPEFAEVAEGNARVRVECRPRMNRRAAITRLFTSLDAVGVPVMLDLGPHDRRVPGRLDFAAAHLALHLALEGLEGHEEMDIGQRPALCALLRYAGASIQRRGQVFLDEQTKQIAKPKRRRMLTTKRQRAFQAVKRGLGLRLSSMAYAGTLGEHVAAVVTARRERAGESDRLGTPKTGCSSARRL